ncbi:MAG: hypothetical protein EOP85_15320 [Verrucomicrobiaceae bacterium]|nr:MAG: hypothetical protein EOP85_15320 [Verrucomicrobiaceae bacterium]
MPAILPGVETEQPHDPVMVEAVRRARNWRRVFWVASLWLMAWTTLVLDQLFTNTFPSPYFLGNLLTSTFTSFFAFLLLVPLGLIGRAVGNLKPLRRYRWWISLVLPLALCCWPLVEAVHQRIDPAAGFRRYFRETLPDGARNVERDLNYVGLDLEVTYSFECSPQETERLIRDFDLHPDKAGPAEIAHAATTGPLMTRLTGWKNPLADHTTFGDSQSKYIEFWTNETFTRVVIRRIDT